MSYRYIAQPQKALSQVLQSFANRIAALERRIRWPGATQFDSDASTTVSTAFVWTDLTTITLDPGSWLLLGGFSFEMTTPTTLTYETWARIVPNDIGADALQSGRAYGTYVTTDSFVVQGFLTVTVETTVTLQARYSPSLLGTPAGTALNAYLLGFPA